MPQQQQTDQILLIPGGRVFDLTPDTEIGLPVPTTEPASQPQYPQQPHPGQAQQQQYPYQSAPRNEGLCCGRRLETYNPKWSVALGITHISIGVLCIIFNIISIILSRNTPDFVCCYHNFPLYVGYGIWTSIFFIIAGGFGIEARSKNPCPVMAFMVMSIFAVVFAFVVIGFSSTGIATVWYEKDPRKDPTYPTYHSFNDYVTAERWNSLKPSRLAMDALLLILGTLEALVAIWSYIFCCSNCRCRDNTGVVHGPATVQYEGQSGRQQVFIHSQGQHETYIFGGQHPQQYAGGSAYPDAEAFAPSMPPAYSAASAPSMPPAYSAASDPPANDGPPHEEKSGVPPAI